MPLDADVKKSIIAEYATVEGDTGSPEVQVALLTQRIKDLTAASCCSSAVAVACCATSRASTSSATVR